MQRDEAKQLLELCRPGNEDDRQDPALAEAFALLEADADLRAWFDAQQAVDARISASMDQVEAPAGLETSILAGMRLHRVHTESGNAAVEPLAFPETGGKTAAPENEGIFPSTVANTSRGQAWWLKPWTGIAALFILAFIILTLPRNDNGSPGDSNITDNTVYAGLPPVLQYLSEEIDALQYKGFDKRDDHAAKLQAYLTSTQAPSPASIPDRLKKIPTVGCVTFEFQGSQLSMICFKNGDVYHLITADKATYPGNLSDTPQIYQAADKAFRVWVETGQVKILTVHGKQNKFSELI